MTIDDEILFGRAAYDAYGRTTGNKNYQGLEMPTWENLTPTIRSAWINAALTVLQHTVPGEEHNYMAGLATVVDGASVPGAAFPVEYIGYTADWTGWHYAP